MILNYDERTKGDDYLARSVLGSMKDFEPTIIPNNYINILLVVNLENNIEE